MRKSILGTLAALALLASPALVTPAFAVDNSISALCDGSDNGYNRAGGFCDQVASNVSLADTKSPRCGEGLVWNAFCGCIPEA